MDIDKQITKAEKKVEQLKNLKAKQQKKKHQRVSSQKQKIVASIVVFCLVASIVFVFIPRVTAADPTIVTATPENGSFFAGTNDGDGVNWAINVSDADTDIAEVELWSNSSGSWVLFYDSGALGGVAYHNTNGQNGNWTGSWAKYWWNISVNDGSWHNTTYSFTTAYQWGDPQMAVMHDTKEYKWSLTLKNNTGDYFLCAVNKTNNRIIIKTSDTGTNWSLESLDDIGGGYYAWSMFTYNNQPYILLYSSNYLHYATWDGSSWSFGSTGLKQYYSPCNSLLADCIYYNGKWNLVTGTQIESNGVADLKLKHYTGTFPSSWTHTGKTFEAGAQYGGYSWWGPSMAILNGTLHLVYKDTGCDLKWQTYDGVTWTNKGTIGGDTLNLGGGTGSGYQYYQGHIVKDPVNQQLVLVYTNATKDLVYRVTDNTTAWSDPHLILSYETYAITYPTLSYMDQRLVISFGYSLRGNYNIYTISAPDYSGRSSGFNYTYNRIQWPDASPGDTYVNSTIFSLKNINNRSIKTITWHFEDLGEIACASNFEVWTNMSGAWTSIGVCDASGDVSTLDISGLMAGGDEWIAGNTTWWKVEILAIGSPSEDIHTTDEDIYYKITF